MSRTLNYNAVNALKFINARIVDSEPTQNICTIGHFTIGIVFKSTLLGMENILIRQEDSFEMGLHLGIPYLKCHGLVENRYEGEQIKVQEDKWCSIYVVYDASFFKMALYINGVCVGEWQNVFISGNIEDKPYLLGEAFTGYIRYIRLYNCCLLPEEISKDPFMEPENTILMYLDFTGHRPLDRGQSNLAILESKKIQSALRTGESGFAEARNSDQINKMIISGSYTVMQKIYLKRGFVFQSSTFSCGNIAFLFENSSGDWNSETINLRLFRDLDNTFMELKGTIFYGEWSLLTAVYDAESKKAYFYINGILADQCDFEFTALRPWKVSFGGSPPYIFPGLIGDTAVYNRALNIKEIEGYMKEIPSMEECGLEAYYSFSTGYALDLKNNMMIDVKAPFRLSDLYEEPSVLKIEEQGAAYLSASNIVEFKEGFAILARFCADEMKDNTTSVLYAHGTPGIQIRMGLTKKMGENNARLFFSFNFQNIFDSNPLELQPRVSFGKWLQYLIVYKKSTNEFKVYLNSDKVFETSIVVTLQKNTNVTVGNSGTGNEPFRGQIEYVAVFNYNLLYALPDIFRNVLPSKNTSGLCGLYTFDGTALDQKTGGELILRDGAKLLPVFGEREETIETSYLVVKGKGRATPENATQIARTVVNGRFSLIFRVYPENKGNYQVNLLNVSLSDRRTLITVFGNNKAEGQELTVFIQGNFSGSGRTILPYDQWSAVCIVAEGSYYIIYVNGIASFKAGFTLSITEIQERQGSVEIGSSTASNVLAYSGRIKSISIFDKVLNANEIARYSAKTPMTAADGLVSLYDFSKGKAIDEKSKELIILSEEAALEIEPNDIGKPVEKTTNLIYALHAEGKGLALDQNTAGFCSALSGGDWSVFAKVLWMPSNNSKSVLMEVREADGEVPGLRISLCNQERMYLKIQSGAKVWDEVEIHDEEILYWMNIGLVFDGTEKLIYIYLNGELRFSKQDVLNRILSNEVYFANSGDADSAFEGYLDSVVLFRKSCTKEEAEGYQTSPPFLFEEGIAALYDFSLLDPIEWITGEKVQLMEGAAITPCEDTQNQITLPSIPNLGKNETYGEYVQWAAAAAYYAGTELPLSIFGVDAREAVLTGGSGSIAQLPKFHGAAVNYLLKYLYNRPPMYRLVSNYPYNGSSNVLDVFSALKESKMLLSLTRAFFPQCSVLLPDMWEWYLDEKVPPKIQNILKDTALKTADKINSMPEPPKLSYKLTVRSVTFCHTQGDAAQSAAKMRRDEIYPTVIPEWQAGINSEANPSRCVYISAQVSDTPFLMLEFDYESNNGTEINMTIKVESLEHGILGDSETVLTLKANDTYQYRVYFPKHTMKQGKPGLYNNKIAWNYQVDGFPVSMVTYHNIYLLSTNPVLPWSQKNEEHLLTYAALCTREKILDFYRRQIGETAAYPSLEQFSAYTTAWIWGSGQFALSTTEANSFAGIGKAGELLFNRDKFDWLISEGEKENPIFVTPLDCSLMIADCARLEGFPDISIGKFTTGLSEFSIDMVENKGKAIPVRGRQWQRPIPLSLRKVKAVGETSFRIPEPSVSHYAAVSFLPAHESVTDYRIFDGCYALQADGKDLLFAGQYFSGADSSFTGEMNPAYYRESFCEAGSCCYPQIRKSWDHGAGTPPDLADKGEGQTGGLVDLYCQPGRNQERWIWDYERLKCGEDWCCTLGLEAIRRILVKTTASLFKDAADGIKGAEFTKRMEALVNCLYSEKPQSTVQTDARIRQLYEQTLKTIADIEMIADKKQAEEFLPEDFEKAARLLALLFYQTSNGVYNWTGGQTEWIPLLEGGFNPSGWVFLSGDNGKYRIEGTFDAFLYPVHGEASQYAPFDKRKPVSEGFYLINDRDARMLNLLFANGSEWLTKDLLWFAMGAFIQEDGNEFPFLYASSNKFAPPHKSELRPFYERVYYTDTSEDAKWKMLMSNAIDSDL